MTTRIRFGFAVSGLAAALVLFSGWMAAGKRPPKAEPSAFAAAVDLTRFGDIAVHGEGRVKSFDSFANGMMAFVTGPRRYQGQSPAFTYLDLMLRPEVYEDADVLFVKNKSLRADIVDALADAGALADDGRGHGHVNGGDGRSLAQRLDDFQKWGLISPRLLGHPAVQQRLDVLGTDLIRSAKFVQEIESAQFVAFQRNLLYDRLTVIPPDDPYQAWLKFGKAKDAGAIDDTLAAELDQHWFDLQTAWKAEDAVAVTAAANALADKLPQANPANYPDTARLHWESWYFHQGNLTWIWMVYLLSVVVLLLWFVYRWRAAGWIGMSIFVIAFLLHTGALGLRWWISGRWPNSNMFEAVTTAAWFGGVAAVVLEIVGRRTAMHNLFALTSAVASMVALMCAHYMPLQLNPNIGNMMPVLHDLWLYIHTNVIIWSYILIFMAAVSGALYLLHRLCGGERAFSVTGGMSMAVATGGGAVGLPELGGAGGGSSGDDPDDERDDEREPRRARAQAVSRPAREAPAAGDASASGEAADGAPAAGDAADAASARPADGPADDAPAPKRPRAKEAGLGAVLDGVTMDLMKLSFVMLWAGLVMGAIWADHSWGRPWGWDPKEVFALNTFLVFAVLVHVRWKARDKGFWTAMLAVVGCGVMLFNWIVINFLITGLHSYA